jgi:predicted ATPase with chaperone activity
MKKILINGAGAGITACAIAEREDVAMRAPHHSCGALACAEQAEMAHDGVLLLDELESFSMQAVDTMARVMKDLPPRALVVRTWGCPCGMAGRLRPSECHCSEQAVARFTVRLQALLEVLGMQCTGECA